MQFLAVRAWVFSVSNSLTRKSKRLISDEKPPSQSNWKKGRERERIEQYIGNYRFSFYLSNGRGRRLCHREKKCPFNTFLILLLLLFSEFDLHKSYSVYMFSGLSLVVFFSLFVHFEKVKSVAFDIVYVHFQIVLAAFCGKWIYIAEKHKHTHADCGKRWNV